MNSYANYNSKVWWYKAIEVASPTFRQQRIALSRQHKHSSKLKASEKVILIDKYRWKSCIRDLFHLPTAARPDFQTAHA